MFLQGEKVGEAPQNNALSDISEGVETALTFMVVVDDVADDQAM